MERSTTFTGHVQVYHNRARAAFGLRGWLRPREHKRATMRLSENACAAGAPRPPTKNLTFPHTKPPTDVAQRHLSVCQCALVQST